MKLLEYSKNKGSTTDELGFTAGKCAVFQLEPKGNGTFKGIVPLRLGTGVVRNTAITLTSQAQTTQAGATRLLLKVDVPYAAEPVDALGTGVYREYGAISAHIVLTIPRRAAQDMGGSNGANATLNARRQADYAQALLLRLLGPVIGKDARKLRALNGGNGEVVTDEYLGCLTADSYPGLVANGQIMAEDTGFVSRRLPIIPQQEDNEVEMHLGPATDAKPFPGATRLTEVQPSPVSMADKTSESDPTAVVDLTVNTAADDAVSFGPVAMLTRAIAGLAPVSDDAVIAPPTFLQGAF